MSSPGGSPEQRPVGQDGKRKLTVLYKGREVHPAVAQLNAERDLVRQLAASGQLELFKPPATE